VAAPGDCWRPTSGNWANSTAASTGRCFGDAELRGDVVVAEGATIESGVVVEGPVLVRSGAEIGPNAYVRGATMLGEDTHVGHGVEIKNSVIRAGSAVPHVSYVGDSVLGIGVNFGAGTQVANLRHDDADVSHTVKGGTRLDRSPKVRRRRGRWRQDRYQHQHQPRRDAVDRRSVQARRIGDAGPLISRGSTSPNRWVKVASFSVQR